MSSLSHRWKRSFTQPYLSEATIWQLLVVTLANGLLVCAPTIWTELRPTLSSIMLFVAGASALCLADLSRSLFATAEHNFPNENDGDREHLAICFAVGATVLGTWWLSIATSQTIALPLSSAVIQVGGFACMLLGAFLRQQAISVLAGDFVSDVSPRNGSELRTTGLYGRVRHPSETGLLLCVLGGALTLGSLPGLIVWGAVLLPLSTVRVRMEETRLTARFGQSYEHYKLRSGRWLPHLSLRNRF